MDTEILLYDGFEELDAFGPFEVLATAGFEPALVTLEPSDRVVGAHGARLEPHGALTESPGLLVVPGGGWSDRSERGAWGEAQRRALPEAIAARHERGTMLAGVCTGGMLIAAAGLVAGRPAITHRSALDDLAAAGAEVIADARVVDDGDIVTASISRSGSSNASMEDRRPSVPPRASNTSDAARSTSAPARPAAPAERRPGTAKRTAQVRFADVA